MTELRGLGFLVAALVGSAACAPPSESTSRPIQDSRVLPAERFIDAFYSFDQSRLARVLSAAEASAPGILFYQGWAKGGNYQIRGRAPCEVEPQHTVRCAITVEDDLIKALGLALYVTDTFRITVSNGQVSHVSTSSNDPPLFREALSWVRNERADRIRVPCDGFFAGGPTPEACVKAVVNGFAEFVSLRVRGDDSASVMQPPNDIRELRRDPDSLW